MNVFNKIVIVLILAVIMPLLITYYNAIETTERITLEQYKKESEFSISIIHNQIEEVLLEMTQLSIYISNDQTVIDALELLESNKLNISDRTEFIDTVDSIILANTTMALPINDLSVSIINSTDVLYSNFAYRNNLSEDFFLSHHIQESAGPFIKWNGLEDNYLLDGANHNPSVITSTKPIVDNNFYDLFGTLIISINTSVIEELMITEDSTISRLIINKSENAIIGNNEDDLEAMGLESDVFYKLLWHREIDESNLVKDLIVTSSYIDKTDWLLVEIKTLEGYSDELNQLNRRYIIINVLAVTFFIIIALLLIRSITKPIHKLSENMQALNLNEKTSLIKGRSSNEIRVLEESFNGMKKNILELIEENALVEIDKRKADLKALQSQINPHFLFNTLNTIRWCAAANKNDKVINMILSLSKLLDTSIMKGNDFITLGEELGLVSDYVFIMNNRQNLDIELSYDLCSESKSYLVPKLILQPLIENSILHGFDNDNVKSVIRISAEQHDDFIITVIDNGLGMTEEQIEYILSSDEGVFSGIGVGNVNERIRLHYGEEYGLRIESKVLEWTKISIVLPLKGYNHII